MGRAAHMLSGGMDLVLRALVLQGIWLLGTLAGGIVLGWAPATMAATDAAACAERGEPIRWRRAAEVWKHTFWRSQITLGLPGLFLLLALVAVLSGTLPLPLRPVPGLAAVLLLVAWPTSPSWTVATVCPPPGCSGARCCSASPRPPRRWCCWPPSPSGAGSC